MHVVRRQSGTRVRHAQWRRRASGCRGEVTFSGTVAGERYVVVRHDDDRRATYGGLASSTLRTGDAVVAGMVVGITAGHLHFGLRDGDTYVDPAPFLGRLVGRARLVPDDGTAARAAPPPRLRCR